MRCNRCGGNIADNSKFCPLCGGKLVTEEKKNTVKPHSNGGFTDVFVSNNVNGFDYHNVSSLTTSQNNNGLDTSNMNSSMNSNVNSTVSTNNNSSTLMGNANTTGNSQNVGTNNFGNNNQNAGTNSFTTNNQNMGMNNNNSNYNNTNQEFNNTNQEFNNTNQGFNNNNNQQFSNGNMNSQNQQVNNGMNFGQQSYSNSTFNSSFNNSKKNKSGFNFKILVPVALVLIVVMLYFVTDGFLLFSGKRTIMVYMIGSDLESDHQAASADIREMIDSKFDTSKVNVLIYTGGSVKWHTEGITNSNAIYKLTGDGIEKLEDYGKLNMGDANTLSTFLNYGYKNFKASKYSLILWDHGGGPIIGYGYDSNYHGSSLTLVRLKTALENSPFKKKKLEMIGFDACLMSSIEVAAVLSDYANYMLSSQEVEPSYGWDYKFLGEIKSGMTTVELGTSIINDYMEFYANIFQKGTGLTLSLVDLSKVKDVEEKLDDLFKDADDNLTIDYSVFSRSRENSKEYGKSGKSSYDLVDLNDLMDNFPESYRSKANMVKSAVDKLVVYQATDLKNTNGISIYFPFANKGTANLGISVYKKIGFAKEYTKFITNFFGKLTGAKLNNWKLTDRAPVVTSDNVISVEVPNEVVSNYSSASYVIFEKVGDNYYMPRIKGTDIDVYNNTFSTTLSKKGLVAYNDEETVYLTAVESENGKDYTKYLIPSVLQKWGSRMSENFTMESAYLEFIVSDDKPNGYIGNAVPISGTEDGELGTLPKLTFELKDWKLIQLINSSYKIFDDAGNYTTDWESSGTITGVEFMISEGFNIEFRDLDPTKEYYALFHITDNQGERYTTQMVRVYL